MQGPRPTTRESEIASVLPPAQRFVLALAMLLAILPPAVASAATIEIVITDGLSESNLSITTGSAVTWLNEDGERHRIRSESGPVEFDSGNVEAGDSFSFIFTTEGIYTYIDYRDRDNSAYHGTITVASDPDPAPDPDNPGGAPDSGLPPPAASDVSIVDRAFRPATIEITVGGSVTWGNDDDRAHTVTASDGTWDSGIFSAGGSYTRTFDTAGSFLYLCLLHPEMAGTVVVTGAGGTPPPVDPPPDQNPESGDQPPATTQPPNEPAPPSTARRDVTIVDFDFRSGTISVPAGSRVSWRNDGAIPHTVTATDSTFDSGFLFSGDAYSRRFDTAGTFNYLCTIHPEMRGTVVVTSPDSGSTVPTTNEPSTDPGNPEPTGPTSLGRAPPAEAATEGSAENVGIVDLAFAPDTVMVQVGATVAWTNEGALPHTVTAEDGAFDSGILSAGDAFETAFDSVGTFNYVCTLHPAMTGSVVVVQTEQSVTGDEAANGPGSATTSADPPSLDAPVSGADLPDAAVGANAVAADSSSGEGGDTPGAAAAFILAGGILAAMAVFVFGMVRFGRAAAQQ